MRRIDYKWLALTVSISGVIMSALDSTIVNIAIPSLIKSFHASVADVQWVITAYLLALGASIPLAGYAADRFGMKRMYASLIAGFTAASMLCGIAPNLEALIAFRVLQGLFGGGLIPLSMALVFRAFPPNEIGRAFGYSGIPVLFAPALGPSLGGYLLEYASWRLIFYVNLPVGIIGVLMTLFWLREYRAPEPPRLDLPGLALSSAGTVAALFGVSEAANSGWGSGTVLVSLAAGAALLAVFVWVELHTESPILDLRLFARPAFLLPMLVMLLSTVAMMGGNFLFPLFLQSLHGYTPLEAGMILLPPALASAVAFPIGGELYDRGGARLPTLLGFSLAIIATVLLLPLDAHTAWPFIAGVLMIRGFGTGMSGLTTTSAAMAAAQGVSEARVSALINVSRQMMGAVSVALMATLLQARVGAHVASGLTIRTLIQAGEAAVHGGVLAFHELFGILVVAAVPLLLLAWRLRDTRPPVPADGAPQAEGLAIHGG